MNKGDRFSHTPSDQFGSARQRVIVLTFNTPEEADAWDDLDTAQALNSLRDPSTANLAIGRAIGFLE